MNIFVNLSLNFRHLKPSINIKLCVMKPNNMVEEQIIKIPLSRISFLADNDSAEEKEVLSQTELAAINTNTRGCQTEVLIYIDC